MLMSYIHGTTAEELRDRNKCEDPLIGTQEQDKAFRKQMASIQIQLASIQFDQIGALYEIDGEVTIGPDPETGKAPGALHQRTIPMS